MANSHRSRSPVVRLPAARISGRSIAIATCDRCSTRFEHYWFQDVPPPVFCDVCKAARNVEIARLEVERITLESQRDLGAVHSAMDHPANLKSGTLGALNELRACIDLMSRGFHVFRAQSPACPCDLIAMRNGTCYRIEVRTARQTPSGRLIYPKGDPARHDVMACVMPTGVVVYLPDIYPTGCLGADPPSTE